MVKEVQTNQGHLTTKVDHLMRVNGATCGEVELPEDVEFPLTSLQQVDALEERLTDDSLKQLIVSYLLCCFLANTSKKIIAYMKYTPNYNIIIYCI